MIRVINSDRRNTTLAVDKKGLDAVKRIRGHQYGRWVTTDIDPESQYLKVQHNKSERANLVKFINQHNLDIEKAGSKKIEPAGRVVVPAGMYKKGDDYNGYTITGLGRSWIIRDPDFYSVHGIHPSIDRVQYAYLSK